MSLGKTRAPAVGCRQVPDIGPGLTLGRPPMIHMSDTPATLGKGVACAPFHRHYYYFDMRKNFRDRGWAR